MNKKIFIFFLLIAVFTGCNQYVYYGIIESDDCSGEMRNHLIYWTKTERLLWFDECSGSIRLLTECSLETIAFDETENGIIFRCTANHKGVTHPVDLGEFCGKIIGVKKIDELSEGVLLLEVYCEYDGDDFTIGNHSYLKAQDEPYEFNVIRKKSSEFENGVPKRPECRE